MKDKRFSQRLFNERRKKTSFIQFASLLLNTKIQIPARRRSTIALLKK